MKLVLFCEAAGDFRTAAGLVDRVLREEGPAWVADLIEAHPEAVRTWMDDGDGHPFFDIHRLSDYARGMPGLRVPQGHFDGKPGAPGALMARRIFHIVRAMAKQAARAGTEPAEAVVIVWDMDQEGDYAREARCWTDAPLDRLHARGEHSGLSAFLGEVREHLVKLCAAPPSPSG